MKLPHGFYRVPDGAEPWNAVAYLIEPEGGWAQQNWRRTEGVSDEEFLALLERAHAKLVGEGCRMLGKAEVVAAVKRGVVLSYSMKKAVLG